MPRRDTALACLVALIWGVNFVAANIGMTGFPPLLFAALRFTLVAFPAVFFVAPPGNGWRTVVAAGAAMGVGQFGLLYCALAMGMPAGLASLVLQVQTVFTIAIAAVVLRERPSRYQLLGVALGVLGMVLVGGRYVLSAPAVPLLMTIAAAASWGAGNVVTRRRPPRNGFSMVVWSALVPPLPLLGLSLLFEGPQRASHALTQLHWMPLLGLAFVTYGASMIGYGLWNLLLSRHAASTVAPWSMLVPPIGMVTAFVHTGESPGLIGVIGGVIITLGVLMALGVGARRRSPGDDEPAPRPAAEPAGL